MGGFSQKIDTQHTRSGLCKCGLFSERVSLRKGRLNESANDLTKEASASDASLPSYDYSVQHEAEYRFLERAISRAERQSLPHPSRN